MIRITGGEFRGRKIKSPPGSSSRPTLDTVREALFNIIGNRLDGIRLLDLYAGVGLVGIEALSRGAKEVVFVEREISLVKVLRENLALLGIKERGKIFHGSALSLVLRLAKKSFDVIFLDPPYHSDDAEIILTKLGFSESKPGELVIVQHSHKERFRDSVGQLRQLRQERYGETMLSFYQPLNS